MSALSFPPPLSVADTVLLLADGPRFRNVYVDRLVRATHTHTHTHSCGWCRWPLRAGLWPVYSPVSPLCFRGPVWTQKQVVSLSSVHWKDKGGTVGVAAVTSVPTRWQIHAGKSSFRRWERSRELLWALITVVWRSCESLSVSLRIKTHTSSCWEPPEDISRSAISHRERNVVKSHNTLIDKHLGPLY